VRFQDGGFSRLVEAALSLAQLAEHVRRRRVMLDPLDPVAPSPTPRPVARTSVTVASGRFSSHQLRSHVSIACASIDSLASVASFCTTWRQWRRESLVDLDLAVHGRGDRDECEGVAVHAVRSPVGGLRWLRLQSVDVPTGECHAKTLSKIVRSGWGSLRQPPSLSA
jgi:hypothetical protein